MDYTDYTYIDGFGAAPTSIAGALIAFFMAWMFVIILLSVFMIICQWIIYKKAGKNGWEAIIPIYNIVVAFEFLDIPMWMIILLFIPGANVALPIIMAIKYSERFGKTSGFAVGLIFLPIIFYPILAFGKSKFN